MKNSIKQFVVIGLGNFGHYLASSLYGKGNEVLAIDVDPDKVQAVKDQVSQAVIADATQGKILQSLGVSKVDAAVVSIGSMMEASALACMNLKDLGVEHIIAKANSEIHSRLLYKVGASQVIFPEKDQALALAERLHNPNILEYMRFVDGYSIVEFAPAQNFMGKRLKDLDLINRYGIQVIAIKGAVGEQLSMIPTGDFIIQPSDILILLGPNAALDKLERLKE
ncbi:TrkA2 [Desulforapulum autotrophicum HRM2]|uniref:TrkA2 n=1 Tax=Desulforapulum autotrophicum (strain ATCC 43914 / DSM 3382 / VKM B-1955 / HRM2) TaxID=177437 RepID=C0QAF7_DESAH|nr:TrkA family potassium uptake protein [Desulforapulum autotrophicum]ACN14742.1 TrkA2 [Desulforapulum autotrophicum HRM2]